MRTRTRVVAALLALIAFSLSFAEGVWASACVPEMAASTAGAASTADQGEHADCEACDEAPTGTSSEEAKNDAPHCPLVIVSGQCSTALSLPSYSPAPPAFSTEGAALLSHPHAASDLLLVSGFFRPPRA